MDDPVAEHLPTDSAFLFVVGMSLFVLLMTNLIMNISRSARIDL